MATTIQVTDEEVFANYPRVPIDHDNIEHYRGLLQRKLLINRCQDCGFWIYPHRDLCRNCWSRNVKPTEVSGKGSIYMYTLVHQDYGGPSRSDLDFSKPYPLIAVELVEQPGLRYLSTVEGIENEDIKIGMPVEMVWVERAGTPQPAFRRASK